MTLAVTQEEAERLVLADRTTDLTFALLGADTPVDNDPGMNPVDVFPETFQGAVG